MDTIHSSNKVDEPTANYTELSQKEKNKYHTLTHIYGIQKDGTDEPICRQQRRHRQGEQTCGQSRGRREWDELREHHGNIHVTTHKIR